MNLTPKMKRKSSLTLSTRIKQKRHSASPQNRFKSAIANDATNSKEIISYSETFLHSPSARVKCSDDGFECTPPNKKMTMNLDECVQFSPKVFDSSFSPTCLLSQTLLADSPEVGWKWNHHFIDGLGGAGRCIENRTERAKDSVYVPDSSYASVGSIKEMARKRDYSYKQRVASDARKDHRQILEQELRRVEYIRAEEKLQQRCERLQEQLKSAGTQKIKANNQLNDANCKIIVKVKSDIISTNDTMQSFNSNSKEVILKTLEKEKNQEILNDFFNDSDSDCFLLEATQEIESRIETSTKRNVKTFCNTIHNISAKSSVPAITSTPSTKPVDVAVTNTSINTENKRKRSSFYMRFLEDDCPDDWFLSLDDPLLQATENKKSQTSLQRYKSMPSNTARRATELNKNNNNDYIAASSTTSSNNRVNAKGKGSSLYTPNMKRHSSCHKL